MFSRNIVLLAAFAASFPALAQNPAAPADQHGKEASRIAEINERIAVMSAQLAEMEMQAKIAAKRAEIGKANESARSFVPEDAFIPSVKEISGVDGNIWAVVNVPGGNTQVVRVGDTVGGWRVMEIQHDSVSVSRGRNTMRLSFGLNPPQPPAPDAPALVGQTGAPMPPYPSN